MRDRIVSMVFTVSLLLVLATLLLLNAFSFISGPAMVQDAHDLEVVQNFEKSNKLTNLVYLNRFALNEVAYLVRDEATVYAISENSILYTSTPLKDDQSALETYAASLGLTGVTYNYGYYHSKIVYTLVSDEAEVYVDPATLTSVFIWRKG